MPVNSAVSVTAMAKALHEWLDGSQVRLYVNDFEPQAGSQPGDFEELNGSGYGPRPASWEFRGRSAVTEVAWSFNAKAGPIYGYFCLDADGGMVQSGRFEMPVIVSTALSRMALEVEVELVNQA